MVLTEFAPLEGHEARHFSARNRKLATGSDGGTRRDFRRRHVDRTPESPAVGSRTLVRSAVSSAVQQVRTGIEM
ncbi:hypothetical protein AAMO2058_000439400 [Amorphochlora amoebiformis]